MKIVQILYSGLGGHGNVFFSMVEGVKSKQIQFEAIFNGVEPIREEYIERCKSNNVIWNYISLKQNGKLSFLVKIFKAIKNANPSALLLHGGVAIMPAYFYKLIYNRKIKIIVRETQANHLKTKSEWLYLSLSLIFASNVVFLSEEYKEVVKKKLRLVYNNKKVVIIPNGINLERFCALPEPINTPILIGMQSRLVPIKDYYTLIDAIRQIVTENKNIEVHLQIAGDGSEKDALLQYTKLKGLSTNITFLGLLNEIELVAFLQRLNLYVHASFGETMSTAVMQAMACNKAIIASDVHGINNMLTNNKTAILVPVKNVQLLTNAIVELCTNTQKKEQLKSQAYNYAQKNFSNEVMVKKYLKLLIQ